MNEYHVIGVMSGSSLDGLDVCYCRFESHENAWAFKLLKAETFTLPEEMISRLSGADALSSPDLMILDADYGEWIGLKLKEWIKAYHLNPSLVSIHGHTVFHAPRSRITLQIGNGQLISLITGLPVADTFRILDILKGGEGAPLVPAGEHYLFKKFNAFLNLGGIANVSVHGPGIRAWDIAPCNQVLNHFAGLLGKPYDHNGELASTGKPDKHWYDLIAGQEYFRRVPPKSLSNQWRKSILDGKLPEPADALHTYGLFLTDQIASELRPHLSPGATLLVTGGGALNGFLIANLKARLPQISLIVPDEFIIHFKEALVFGFLGLLRQLDQVNIFSSVTGAHEDSIGGCMHYPF